MRDESKPPRHYYTPRDPQGRHHMRLDMSFIDHVKLGTYDEAVCGCWNHHDTIIAAEFARAEKMAERLRYYLAQDEYRHSIKPCVCSDRGDPCCLQADIDKARAALEAYEANAAADVTCEDCGRQFLVPVGYMCACPDCGDGIAREENRKDNEGKPIPK